MAALLYLVFATALGDGIFRRFCRPKSRFHAWAAAFLVGTLISAWITYLFALAFAAARWPLVWANMSYFITAAVGILVLRRFRQRISSANFTTSLVEIFFFTTFVAVSCWLMFGSFTTHSGDIRLSSVVWNDFGPNLALMQSFAVGHNFPTEYPYFIGQPIRYHFLFWFAAGNLEFLGLNPAWALNLLSVASMVALLVSILTLGFVLFDSWLIGGLAALLLFFHGSLSFIPFLRSQTGLLSTFESIGHLDHWLSSGFPFPGENWGIWSISILYVQRHLVGAIGILCLVLTFVIEQGRKTDRRVESTSNRESLNYSPFIFSGALIGLLPVWNSPVFLSGIALVSCLFVVFPHRRYAAALLATALVMGLPQILFLGLARTAIRFPVFHWGFTIEHPMIPLLLSYFLFTFGSKLALGLIALPLLPKDRGLFFAAIAVLVFLAFGTRLSIEIMNNQKFLLLWVLFLNLFVAFTLVRLFRAGLLGKIGAIGCAVLITGTGVIELFRVHNDNWVDVPFRNNALSEWLFHNTKPTDVFLSDRYVHHPLLTTGRRIFYGWPYFAWSMGYNTGERDALYAQIFGEQSPASLLRLLKQNGISYVAIDDGLRRGDFKVREREAVFASVSEKVFRDNERRFGDLTIYRVRN
jgi:hypothetical protein